MRLSTSLTFLTCIGLAFLLFYNLGTPDAASGSLLTYNSTIYNSTTSNYIFDYFSNPADIFNSTFWLIMITTLLVTFGAAALFSGVLKVTQSDAVLFSVWPIAILTYGNFWISLIWVDLTKELNSYMSPGSFGAMPMLIALAFVAIPAIQFLMGVYQAWRTGFVNS